MYRKLIRLPTFSRGSHLITDIILSNLSEIRTVECGMLNLFLQHTSAAISINENADSRVPGDLAMGLDRVVPESWPYEHDDEGPDDMPAHLKSTLVGASLNIPIGNGRCLLGTWQGIYLLEFRNAPHSRQLIATIMS